MQLLLTKHITDRLLTSLNSILQDHYPHVDRANLGLQCELKKIRWWVIDEDSNLDILYRLCAQLRRTHIPDIALQLAHHALLTDLGMMGYAMLTSRNLEQAVLIAGHALEQAEYPVKSSVVIRDDIAEVHFRCDNLNPEYRRILLDIGTLSAWRYIQALIPEGRHMVPSAVFVSTSKDPLSERHSHYYGCEVTFNAQSDCICIPASSLLRRIPTGDSQLLRDCNLQMHHVMNALPSSGGIVGKVKTILFEQPQDCAFKLDDTARLLNMNPNTLRRQLIEKGTSFRALSNEVRMELASQYLVQTAMPIKQIAYQLCYHEPNNFIRAFKACRGLSPLQYRKQSVAESVTHGQ